MSNRRFGLGVAALLSIMAALQVTSALRECQTYDEHIHIAAGYAYWKTGAYWFNMEHPALVKLIAAVPLLWLNPRLDTDSAVYRESRDRELGVEFLYHNRIPANRILFAARLPMMAIGIAFGLFLALWVRSKFGAQAALAALLLYCFDPNIVAHSRYVTTDLPMTAAFFVACAGWMRYLEKSRLRDLLLASVLFGIAMVTKYSAALLIPVFGLLYAIRWWQKPLQFPIRRLVTMAAVLTTVTLAVILVVYWPDTLRCLRGRAESFARWGDPHTFTGRFLAFLGRWVHLPTHTFPFGLEMVADHNRVGHQTYLLGRLSTLGWWYYFPVAFAVKSTMAALLSLLLLLGLAMRVTWRNLRTVPLVWYTLALPPLVYFGASMTSSINIGVRHILPVYPFVYVVTVAVLAAGDQRRWRHGLLAVVLFLQAAESAAIYPHYLAFFNALSGGPGNGPRYLADSNIDWGQDLKKLARWLNVHGTNRAYIAYFGNDQMSNEGIQAFNVPSTDDQHGREGIDGYVAASVTHLVGTYVGAEPLAWLRERKPVAKVGYSIYVYDLRKQPALAFGATPMRAQAQAQKNQPAAN